MITPYRKKLIEVALPLNDINGAAQAENNIHTGLPANLHTWWSRKPLGVARAIIFSSLVDDPGEYLSDKQATSKREELFAIISRLADVKNGDNKELFKQAEEEILNSNDGCRPAFWDPFCGGGSLPLEALRLGLPSIGSDINPVAVFMTRIMLSLAPRQAQHAPINNGKKTKLIEAGMHFDGLKRDVEFYAKKIHTQLSQRLGRYYPEARIPKKHGGGTGQVVAWIWARTVICPNPSCRATTPLVNKFLLSTHQGNEAHVVPIYDRDKKTFQFTIHQGGHAPNGTVNRSGARCLSCKNPIPFEYIRMEGVASRIQYSLMAMAVEGPHERIYLEPTEEHLDAAHTCEASWEPDSNLPDSALGFRVQRYGITKHKDLFTKRQMMALSCLADSIADIRQNIIHDAGGDVAYADLVQSFLALSLSRVAQTNNTIVRWLVRTSGTSKGTPAFDRQIVSMVWEFSEGNILGKSVGSWLAAVKNPLTALNSIPASELTGEALLHDAASLWCREGKYVISTDPPYFDSIGYADLSDFFYVWLRKAMGSIYPDLFGTVLVPKLADMTCNLGRKDVPKNDSTQHFLERLHAAFEVVREKASDHIPVTVYYAFKQTEGETSFDSDEIQLATTTGWETLLEGLIRSNFCITGTWPLRTESASRLRAIGSNALASSIVLVCRKRDEKAEVITRGDFRKKLRSELPEALKKLQQGYIAPVDLAQASIGPGMAIFSRYSKVIEADGSPMTVKTALQLINQALDEYLTEQEGEYDPDTRFAITWFETHGFNTGQFGEAETLAKARNVSVEGVKDAGIIHSAAGKVRLLKRDEIPDDWNPLTDDRPTIWEATQHLIKRLDSGGEPEAAELLTALGSNATPARDLAYRLYTTCERKKWAEEARAYNSIVVSWPELEKLAASIVTKRPPEQGRLL